jgi:hypothetical protein
VAITTPSASTRPVREFDCTRLGVEAGSGGAEQPVRPKIVVVGLER